MGVTVDPHLASARNGVYTFHAQGCVVDELGALVPRDGRKPSFAQVYFYDPAEQVRRRLAVFMHGRSANGQQQDQPPNQQQAQPQNQQEYQLQEDVPAEDNMGPYDPIAQDAVDQDAPVPEENAADDVLEPGQILAVEDGLDPECILSLQTMLEQKNRFCAVYKNIREREAAQGGVVEHYKILLKAARDKKAPRRRQYDILSANEIAILIPGDETAAEKRDILIEGKGGGLRRIYETHPTYDPLQYVLLHPVGEDGWTHNTHLMLDRNGVEPACPGANELADADAPEEAETDEGEAQVQEEQPTDVALEENNDNGDDDNRDERLGGDEEDDDEDFWVDFNLDGTEMDEGPKARYVSTRAYYAYRLQIRSISERDPRSYFWLFGRLCHHYVVDQYAKIAT